MFFFFFNDTATTEIYTLSLHDALPISIPAAVSCWCAPSTRSTSEPLAIRITADRKSTRLNSSHSQISYAVFCLKKKKEIIRASAVGHEFIGANRNAHLCKSLEHLDSTF